MEPPSPIHDAGEEITPISAPAAGSSERPPRSPFPVVGIGASAGGLEAFLDFFKIMPSDSGLAFVLIQHLPPERESLMADIVSKHTQMQVHQVEDGIAVEPNHVYVIRPGHTLTIEAGHLHLGQPVEQAGHRRPVDDFFRSLAEEQRERAICIIMSGMGSNGTAGAEVVKAVGGICIAQAPESAKFPSMPRHMIDAGIADFVLRPHEIPEVLIRYATHPYATGAQTAELAETGERHSLHEVLAIVRARTRHDFNDYKNATLIRRIQRRMGLAQIVRMRDYAQMLSQSPSEVNALVNDMMIHVTGFFRDSDAWEALRQQVIEPLIQQREANGPIRAWVTACSTGEEAFTLAMLLTEAAEAKNKRFDIKIFATDTGELSLAQARAGIFPGGIESEISAQRIERFFDKDDAVYRVKKDLRELVVFAPQNLLEDPPFSRLDICTCRNLLIYLKPEVQQRVLWLLHFGLRDGGALLLGNSEMATGAEGLFEPIDKKCRIYRRIGPTRHGLMEFPRRHLSNEEAGTFDDRTPARPLSRLSVSQQAHRALLDRYTPPAVVVDRQYRIVYFHGDTAMYLDHPHGEPTQDLFSLVRESLRGTTRSALHKAMATNQSAILPDGLVEDGGKQFRVEVAAAPLDQKAANSPYYIVSFHRRLEESAVPLDLTEQHMMNQGQLEEELRRVQHELQSTIEELQTSNEEMKASNEEITSVNEELQSTNEELETSKEELQSLNEELATVNAQLQAKMEELQETTSDLSSLLSSTDIAVLFLDTRFRIRRFTPAAKDLVDMIPSDLGRPLSDLARKFDDPELLQNAQTVLDKLIPLEKEITSNSGKAYLRRILPYRTTDNRIDGIVITFVDITARKHAELSLRESEELYRLIVQSVNEYAIFAFDAEGHINLCNAGAERVLGYTRDDVLGKAATMIFTPEDRDADEWDHQLIRARDGGEVWDEGWHIRKDGTRFWASGILTAVHRRDGRLYGFVKILRDNTDRKRAEESLRLAKDAAESANAAKDRFLANVSHELRTPLAATLLWANMLKERGSTSPTQLHEGLEVIRRSAEAQKELIEDLLDTSRITAGELRLHFSPTDLSPLARSAVDAILPSAVARGIQVQMKLDPEVGIVRVDPHRMQQVIWNLVSNAVKFSSPGGAVQITLSRKEKRVQIQVADSGQGISQDLLPHIFERFRQGESSPNRLNSGLGLGLAIAKNLVELHGGEITAHSDGEGEGSVFTVSLPLPRLPDLAGKDTPSAADAIDRLNGKRILLVEDVEETRNALVVLLGRIGVALVAFGTAEEALAEFKRSRPDLILSDIGLPDMDGYALLREIRKLEAEQKSPPVPAVAITAYDSARAQAHAIESGFQQYLTKPAEPQELIAALAALLPN